MPQEIHDVAIIGGGVSGVYAGWRLLKDSPKANIAIYEAEDRIGGRLLSVTPPGIPDMVAELGGMRILPKVQPLVTNLIAALNAGAKEGETIETFPFPVDEPENIAFVRGIRLRLKDFVNNPDGVPYRLEPDEYGQTPGAIMVNAIEKIVPGITNPNLDEQARQKMCREATFHGRPLFQQGFWNVLLRALSNEGYHLGLDAGGYESVLSNWNASDAIPWFLSDFGVAPEYLGFVKGFQGVPLTLAKRFEDLGGGIHLDTKITGVEWKESHFEVARDGGEPIRAKRLILAMPRRALDLLAPTSPLLRHEHTAKLIKAVTPRPLFKVFTTYACPWWVSAGVRAGRTVTDLPVRQTYYWPKNDGTSATKGPAMLMASYDDGNNISFWDGLRFRRGQGWRDEKRQTIPMETYDSGPDTEESGDWHKHKAPKEMVLEIMRQVAEVHDLDPIHPLAASFRDWGDDPYGGGWNSWNIGVKSWEVIEKIVQPDEDVPLYICGEAYSDAQGWVEGALQTADILLEKFGIGPLQA